MKISIVNPSRGRAKIAYNFCQHIWNTKSNVIEHEYILSIDTDEEDEYKRFFKEDFCNKHGVKVIVSDNKHHVDAVNAGAKHATGDMIVVTGDDWIFPFHWNMLLYSVVKDRLNEEYVISINDGIQPRIITLPILSRKYYERFGYVYWREYLSMFADTDFTEVAYKLNRVIEAKNLFFKHNHYTIKGGMKKDATYDKQNSPQSWAIGERIYNERSAKNFYLE